MNKMRMLRSRPKNVFFVLFAKLSLVVYTAIAFSASVERRPACGNLHLDRFSELGIVRGDDGTIGRLSEI